MPTIDRLAQSFLDRYWDQQLPVDPVAIACAAGVRVFASPTLDHVVAGSIQDGGPAIDYNGHEPLVRQRFAIAHALGHVALGHGPRPAEPVGAFVRNHPDPFEAAANRFATELLMPAVVVNGLIRKHNLTDVERLASLFNVSDVAMKHRLQQLEWL